MKATVKIRTEINPLASSLSSSLKSSRRPPPSLTLLDATPLRHHAGRRKHNYRQCSNRRRKQTTYSAVKYQYHPISPDGRDMHRILAEQEDGRTFIDWLFLRPFRCKHILGNQASGNLNSIARIFSMPGMPSAVKLLCGSIDKALTLEQVLASAVGILSDGNETTMSGPVMRKRLSEISFAVGSGPIIRYTNGDEELILPTSSTGIVLEEAFNTVKNVCGFNEDCSANNVLKVFTKQEMTCPIGDTLHHVELRATSVKEEIVFRLGRRQTDNECQTIIRDACHRFLATSVQNNLFLFLITGSPLSGKSTALREFRKTLSNSNGFHQWNIIDGNKIANVSTATDNLSSCVHAYTKEIMTSNIGKLKERLPYVIMFDDLSLEQGLPMAQDIARSGIHVIATIGNDCAVEHDSLELTTFLTLSTNCVKTMVLEIRPDRNDGGYGRSSGNKASLRKRNLRHIESRYRMTSIGNSSKRLKQIVN